MTTMPHYSPASQWIAGTAALGMHVLLLLLVVFSVQAPRPTPTVEVQLWDIPELALTKPPVAPIPAIAPIEPIAVPKEPELNQVEPVKSEQAPPELTRPEQAPPEAPAIVTKKVVPNKPAAPPKASSTSPKTATVEKKKPALSTPSKSELESASQQQAANRQAALQRLLGQSQQASQIQSVAQQSALFEQSVAQAIRSRVFFNTAPYPKNNAMVQIKISIDASGKITDSTTEVSSGIQGFDDSVRQGVNRLEKLPPHPSGKYPQSMIIRYRMFDLNP